MCSFIKCWIIWLWVVAYQSLKTMKKSSWVIPKVVPVAYGSSLLWELQFKSDFTRVVVTRTGRLQELLQGELWQYFANFCLIFYFSIQTQSVLLYTFELRKNSGKVESQMPPFGHSGLSCSKVGKPIHWIVQLVSLILNCWIVIYPVDSAIQCLNNRGQISKLHARTGHLCKTMPSC